MSPPPMDATRCHPSSRAMSVTTMSSHSCGCSTNHPVSTTKAASAPRFMRFLPGSISGFDLIRPDSFRNATIEPVNVTAPMNTPMNTSAWWIPSVPRSSRRLASAPAGFASTCRYPFQPTSTAASPTKLCNSAISSGMPVISTLRARWSPIAAPITVAVSSRPRPNPPMSCATARAMVASSATTMPAMPNVLPALALSCFDSPASARMKSRAATMYAACATMSTLMEVLEYSGPKPVRARLPVSWSGTCRASAASRRSRRRR